MGFKISNCQFSFLEMTNLFGHGSIANQTPVGVSSWFEKVGSKTKRVSENETFFSRSRKAKIITTPLKYSGTGIHTLKYFQDYNLSLT